MKGNKSYRSFKKIIIVITILSMLIPIIGILSILTIAATTETSADFTGYSNGMTASALEDATNAEKNADGTYTNPVSNTEPQITFLIPGFGSQASTWSNNFETGKTAKGAEKLSYNNNSLLEKLRDYANADIYYAKVTTTYPIEAPINGIYGDELGVESIDYSLYVYPDICIDTSCTSQSCIFKNEYDEYYDVAANLVTQLTDISNHIVILFDPADSTGSNSQIYEQFNYVADKIVYDVKTLNGGELPKVNLIGHSRGGLTAMQYALDHPYIVDGLFTIGTPFSGSFLGQNEDILSILEMSADRSNQNFTFGVEDIMNSSVYEGYMNRWNEGYDEKYAHINFHAIGGAVTGRGLSYILANDYYDYDSNIGFKIVEFAIGYLNLQTLPLDLIQKILFDEPIFYIPDDIFIHLESQLAYGYTGVENYVRVFEEDNIDLSMLAQADLALPHNLEPGDAIIHNYILRNINAGNVDGYWLNDDNTYTLLGKGIGPDSKGVLTIPSSYNGLPVTKIAPFAFANNSNIRQVNIPDSIKEIGYRAFYKCGALHDVEISNTSTLEVIKEEAFYSCINLDNISIPATVVNIEHRAFVSTGISTVTLGAALVEISPTAFATRNFRQYAISANNSKYSVVDGILYSKDGTRLISYPCKKEGTSFTLPSTITSIEQRAFYNAIYLNSVNLGGLEYVPDEAFLNCSSLATITAPNLLLAEASSFKNTAFMNSESDVKTLGKVLLKYSGAASSLVVDEYYSIAPEAFKGNTNLTNITIGGDIYNIGEAAFLGCDNLVNIYLDTAIFVNVEIVPFDSEVTNRKIYVAANLLEEYKTSNLWFTYRNDISTHETVIKFDSNGGSSVLDGTVLYYSQIGELPTPSRPGYTFVGWTRMADDQVVAVNSYDVWTSFDTEVTFGASWTIDNYSIVLYPNGGTVEDDYYLYTVNDSVDMPIPVKTGYTFVGWYDNETFAGESATAIPVGSIGNKIYYAKWTANSYTITLNYGYDGAATGVTHTVEFGESFILPVATRDCFSFNGWYYEDRQYTGSSGVSVCNWDIANDVTLNASWTLEEYYVKLVIDDEGNEMYYWMTSTGISPNQTPIKYGEKFPDVESINASFNPNRVSMKEGHKFAYFTKEPISSRTIPQQYMFDDIVMNVSEDVTEIIISLYAYFVPETDFTIIFKDYTTSANGTELQRFVADFNESISYPQPSKIGYSFSGWMVSEENGDAFNNTDLSNSTIFTKTLMPDLSPFKEEDGSLIYLAAVFSPNVITIQYDSNGGSSVGNTTIEYGSTGDTFPIPTRKGYTFDGWYSSGGVQVSDADGILIGKWNIATNPATLIARWKLITYTITYVTDGGTHSNPSTYNISSEFALSDATKAGHEFVAWYTTSSYTTQVEKIGPAQTGNITLYAKFLPLLYTATFVDANGSSTSFQGFIGTVITTPALDEAYIYASDTDKIEGEILYTINGNVTYKAYEKTYSECYNSTSLTYDIYTKNQLNNLLLEKSGSSINVKLKRDISWNGSWTQIPNWYGVFDGGGFCITNVSVSVSGNSSGSFGMFCSNHGTITNLCINEIVVTVSSSTNSNTSYVGSVVGTNYGTINNLNIYGVDITSLKSASSVGGVVGNNAGECKYCVVQSVTIDSYGDMGVIAGTCSGSGARIKACYIYGNSVTLSIRGANRSAGGIVGYLTNRATVEYCSVMGVEFKFGSYEGIDKKDLAPRIGYIVGHAENAIVSNVRIIGVSIDYGGLPAIFYEFFISYNPRKYVCSAGNGTCGLSNNGTTITNTNWDGNASNIP